MITLRLVLWILAMVAFLLAALRKDTAQVNFTGLGLLLWLLGTIAG
jgi:hypothetical protein